MPRLRGNRQRSRYTPRAANSAGWDFTILEAYAELQKQLPSKPDEAAAMRWAIEQARLADRGREHEWPSGRDPETKRTLLQYARENVRDWLVAYRRRFP